MGFGKLPGGMGNIGGLMKQAQKMMAQAQQVEQELAALKVEGAAGGGIVKVEATAAGEVTSVTIQPEAVDPDDVEMLQDLVLAAVREALERAKQTRLEKMNALTGGMNIPGLPQGLF